MTERRFNYRFLTIWLSSLLVFGICVYFVHGYQLRHNASYMLDQAQRAESAGDRKRAGDYLSRYLGIVPKDADALARYGLLLSEPSANITPRERQQSLKVLEKALYEDPSRHDVRRRIVQVSMELGNLSGARDDLQKLLIEHRDDGELEGMLGNCHAGLGDFRKARECLERAISHSPKIIKSYAQLASLLRDHSKDVQSSKESAADVRKVADAVMNNLVANNNKSYRAFLHRAEYLRKYNSKSDETIAKSIEQDIARARELEPEAIEVLLMSAAVSRDCARLDEARGLLQKACQIFPNDARPYLELARLEKADSRSDVAIAVLRQGLVKLRNNNEILWNLADLLIQAGHNYEAAEIIAKLSKLGVPEANCSVLSSRILLKEQKWLEASRMLERAISSLIGRHGISEGPTTFHLTQQAGILLGGCYGQTGDFDRAFLAYGRVLARDSRSIPALLGLAATLEAMGHYAEALDHYRQLLLVEGVPSSVLIEIARLTLLRTLGQESARRDWREADKAIATAERLKPIPVQVVILRSEYLASLNKLEEARSHLLSQYGDPSNRPVEVWISLAGIELRQNRRAEALALLDEAERNYKNSPDLRLARGRFLATQKSNEVGSSLLRLAEGAEAFSPIDRQKLLNGLAALAMQLGDDKVASQLWGRLANEYPNDLRYRLVLFDVAAHQKDESGMQKLIEEMFRIEGEGGTMWRFARASLLVGRAMNGDKSGLAESRTLLAAVAMRRPKWTRADLCQARLDDLDKKPDAALLGYQKAIQSGERDPVAFRRAIELLYERRRYSEAFDLLRHFPDPGSLSQDLRRIGAEIALYSNNTQVALDMAEAAVANGSKDYRDYLWLGRVYIAAGQVVKARPVFEKARELANEQPDVWVALIQHLAATGRKDQALVEIEAATKHLLGNGALLALAHCYEAVGQSDRANESYEAARVANPHDVSVLRGIAGFYIRSSQLQLAVPHLRHLGIDLKSEHPIPAAWARRTLAIVLALQGNSARTNEALALLAADEEASRSVDVSNFQRTRAAILAMQAARKSRLEAVRILEKLIERRTATPEDHFLAAQLYEALNDWPRARRRYLILLDIPGADTPVHLYICARSLLRHGDGEEAKPFIRQLESRDASSYYTQELKARLLHCEGKTEQAIALLDSQSKIKDAKILTIAAALSEIDAHTAAEEMYRREADRTGRPEDALTLSQYLLSRKRYREALDICDRIWTQAPGTAVVELVISILSSAGDPLLCERVDKRLQESLTKSPEEAELLIALATVRDFQGRYEDAEKYYRQALGKKSQHTTALNNLAWMILLRGGNPSEALELVQRAVEIAGLDTNVLDTRGMAYLALKLPQSIELATKDLEAAAIESPSPSAYFHLAQAYGAAGKRKEANEAWKKAKSLGLVPEILHPLERSKLEDFARQFN